MRFEFKAVTSLLIINHALGSCCPGVSENIPHSFSSIEIQEQIMGKNWYVIEILEHIKRKNIHTYRLISMKKKFNVLLKSKKFLKLKPLSLGSKVISLDPLICHDCVFL